MSLRAPAGRDPCRSLGGRAGANEPDLVGEDDYLHAVFLFDRAVDGRIRRYWAAAGFWSFWVGSLHEFVGWFLGRVPLDHLPSANITIDGAAVSNGQFGIADEI